MNWLVFHIVSGQSFFSGIALLVARAAVSTSSKPVLRRLAVLGAVISLVAVVVSSTPIPYWYYGVALLVTIGWGVTFSFKKWHRRVALAVIVVWVVAALIEIPYHIVPTLTQPTPRSLTIIGDSVTAGMGGEDRSETWPTILAHEHDVEIQDISHVGETAASALKRLQDNPILSKLVILEIGGNDLLGSTTSAQFGHDLDALLSHVASPGRQILMFELPLPPFSHEYGRIQRLLARKYRVRLIPKEQFLRILAGNGSTLDSIHLSQAGHRQMADLVWRLVGPR